MLNCGRVVLLCGLLALAVAAGGCQRGPTWNLTPVEGTVTKDGRPLRGIEVVFLADTDTGTQGPRATGRTDEAGHYRLRTDNGDEGGVVGKHRVLVLDPEARKGRRGSPLGPQRPGTTKRVGEQRKTAERPPRVLPRYGSFSETPLRVEVGREPLVFDIVIP